ncbi:MAG: IS1380 family transposase [Actinomycetota bacterium]
MATSQPALSLPLVPRKEVAVDWEGGELSSDGGWLLLALADRQLRLTDRLAAAIEDVRTPERIQHRLQDLLKQRIFQIAQGYEDANDAQTLRRDPLLKVAVGRGPSGPPLAGQSTLSRWENWVTAADLERLEFVLQDLFVAQIGDKPQRVVLDFDPYDDPCHGQQQGVLFNGYYDCHCYLPMVICGTVDDGPQHLIGVVLRDGAAPPTREAAGFLTDVVTAIREKHPDVEIIMRGDAGYGVPEMMTACRGLNVRFCFGKGRNSVLLRLAEEAQARAERAEAMRQERGRRPRSCRVFDDFEYRAGKWKRAERVVVKWEITYGSPNPRFVVTDLLQTKGWTPHGVKRFYSGRGDRENRIKEFKLDMDGDRLSCSSFLANQFRLILHAAAYLLYQALQAEIKKVAPAGELAHAQVGTLRSRFMKVAARVKERYRVVRVHLCSSFPHRVLWQTIIEGLVAGVT